MCFYYSIIQNLHTYRIFVSFTTLYRRGRRKKMERFLICFIFQIVHSINIIMKLCYFSLLVIIVNIYSLFLQVSKDGLNWTTLYTHVDDGSLNEPGSTSSWPLEPPAEETQGWRHVRLQQTGKNASGQTHYLSLSGFEIYGTVTGVCEDLGETLFCQQNSGFLPVSHLSWDYSVIVLCPLSSICNTI